jgi:hypothetical protein
MRDREVLDFCPELVRDASASSVRPRPLHSVAISAMRG